MPSPPRAPAPPLRPEDLRGTLLGTRLDALLLAGERGWTALLPLRRGAGRARPDRRPAANHRQPGAYLDLRVETNRLVADFRDTA